MINQVYQLVSPKVFSVKYDDVSYGDKLIVQPEEIRIQIHDVTVLSVCSIVRNL